MRQVFVVLLPSNGCHFAQHDSFTVLQAVRTKAKPSRVSNLVAIVVIIELKNYRPNIPGIPPPMPPIFAIIFCILPIFFIICCI